MPSTFGPRPTETSIRSASTVSPSPQWKRAGRDDRRLEGDVLSALDRDRVRILEAPGAAHPFDAVGLEERRDARGHLLDDGRLPLVRGREVELGLAHLHAELGEGLL